MRVMRASLAGLLLWLPLPVLAISFTPFGSQGEGGAFFGQAFAIGTGGAVHEIDAFLAISGRDLNGSASGVTARLSADALPTGLTFGFSPTLSPDASDLGLRYAFTNGTGATLSQVYFLAFLDAEIDEPFNTFFNEYGEASGTVGNGALDPYPDSWEIDEPGFLFGDIIDHLNNGALDGNNGVPAGSPDDVALALGFALGDLAPGQSAFIDLLISEDADFVGNLALTQKDTAFESTTSITFSGQATVTENTVPEPATSWLIGICLAALTVARLRPTRIPR